LDGDIGITNSSGTTTLGSAGNFLNISGNLTVNGGTTSAFANVNNATVQAKSVNISGGTITADKLGTSNLTLSGGNVSVNVSPIIINPTVTVAGNGTVSVSAPSTLTANVTNTGNGTTAVTANGALTLNKIQVEGTGAASFTGTSVNDTTSRIFVYGPASFTATAGNVTINKGNHSFGPVSVAATGEAVVVEDAATQLNVVNTPKLTLRSSDYVFQAPTTGVIGSATTSVTAVGNINLGAVANAAGAYTLSGKDITLANTGASNVTLTGANVSVTSTGAITLNNVTAGGTLGVNSTGAITQAADTKIQAVGAVSFVGTGLTAANAGNGFGALTIDVGAGGNVSLTEETTLNLASLRAAGVILKSTNNVITTGVLPVSADTFNVIVGGDFVPAANFRAVNPLTVLATGNVDLGALSLATNLNNKSPSIIAKGYKAPQP